MGPIRDVISKSRIFGELVVFLWQRKLWWLIPMITVLVLLGLLLIFTSSSGMAPFIYTLF